LREEGLQGRDGTADYCQVYFQMRPEADVHAAYLEGSAAVGKEMTPARKGDDVLGR
jgi:hypothetical protein